MMKKVIVLCVLFLPTLLFAQFQGGINFTVVAPQDEFKENVDNLGYGVAGDFLVRPGDGQFGFGGGLGFSIYGSETRRVPFSLTIPEVKVDVETTNNILFGHLELQYRFLTGPVQPYVEGLFGFNYLFTETAIKDTDHDWDDDYDDEIASNTNQSDFTNSYGIGAGLMFKLLDIKNEDKSKKVGGMYLDLKVRSLTGGEGEYLKEGSIERSTTGDLSFDVEKSKISMLTYHIGLVFQF